MFSSLRRLLNTAPTRRPAKRYRPGFEALEDRAVPSVTRPSFDGNDTRAGAINIGTLPAPGTVVKTGSVGTALDSQDYYKFTNSGTGAVQLTITLSGLSRDLDIQLQRSTGAVLASSTLGGTSVDRINGTIG